MKVANAPANSTNISDEDQKHPKFNSIEKQ